VITTENEEPVSDLPVQIRRLLLATDLGQSSELASDRAIQIAHERRADLLVVSVIDPHELTQQTGRFGTRWDQVRDRRHDAARRLVARGNAIGISVTFLVWTGNPGESIVAAAEAEKVDLIIVGTHGRGAIGRLLLGSVSEYVVRKAPCPVFVVRPAPGDTGPQVLVPSPHAGTS
jgi:nucleotide-binding universal stress UspA family protein